MFSPEDKASRQNNRFMGKTMKPRNPFSDSDIMKKGSAHATPKRAKHQKRQIENELMGSAEDVAEMENPPYDPSYDNFIDHKEGSCCDNPDYDEPHDRFFDDLDRELEEDLFRDDMYGDFDRGLRLAA